MFDKRTFLASANSKIYGPARQTSAQHLIDLLGLLASICIVLPSHQILCPRKNKSAVGVEHLNQDLQKLLNPQHTGKQEMPVLLQPFRAAGSRRAECMWRVGDRVMHLENDPVKEVYHGDLGYIESVDPKSRYENKVSDKTLQSSFQCHPRRPA